MSKAPKVKIKTQPAVVMEAEVARKIRQHCRTSMKAEVCGVLIGESSEDRTVVQACIAGENAAQGGAHVTFTQDTWEHIYKIKDKEFPDAKIVGWYHSHPGFGVFLSEHDLFIHENFFSSPTQIAWVFDPHTDEEGCFGWIGGKTEKLSGVRFGYSQSVELTEHSATQAEDFDGDVQANDFSGKDFLGKRNPASRAEEPVWVKWISWGLGCFAILVLGAAAGFILGERQIAKQVERELGPMLGACQEMTRHPVEACQAILQQLGPLPGASVSPDIKGAMPGGPSQAIPPAGVAPQNVAPANIAPANKGKNGKR